MNKQERKTFRRIINEIKINLNINKYSKILDNLRVLEMLVELDEEKYGSRGNKIATSRFEGSKRK